MIGGYLYSRLDEEVDTRLRAILEDSFNRVEVWENGYFFYDDSFQDNQASHLISGEMIALSQDILVIRDSDAGYRSLSLQKEFPGMFKKEGSNAFNLISSDFRMILVSRMNGGKNLFMVSNRAGAGRIYYHRLPTGILLASDLRFLLRIIPFNVSISGIYSILKYGAVPEPMTISNDVLAVPPAHYVKYDLNSGEYSTKSYFKLEFTYPDDDGPYNIEPAILEPIKDVLLQSSKFLGTYDPGMLLSGGIDSSLYASYLSQTYKKKLQAFYCAFGENDPELPFAKSMAEQIYANLQIAYMREPDALNIVENTVQLTDHPFADFSSMPMVFLLKYIKEHFTESAVIIECNGGDDCFGFPDLTTEKKFIFKHHFPSFLKRVISSLLKNSAHWKWESLEGTKARLLSLTDVHETTPLNYFLVLPPLNYLGLETPQGWDDNLLQRVMEDVFSACGKDYEGLGYKARVTIRQLIHVNSRRWSAKALSVGESLGLRLIYPYIWHEVLVEQGRLPWNAKIHNGVIKWPLKKLLEAFMPKPFIYRKKSGFIPPFAKWLNYRDFNHKVRDILLDRRGYTLEIVPSRILDELLSDALDGKKLRHPVLNFLWGALFTEMWIQRYKSY